jgi:hypothetical protein
VPGLALRESDGPACKKSKNRCDVEEGKPTWKTGGFRGREQSGQWRRAMSILMAPSTLGSVSDAGTTTTAPAVPSCTSTSCLTGICGGGSSLGFLELWSPVSIANGEPLRNAFRDKICYR